MMSLSASDCRVPIPRIKESKLRPPLSEDAEKCSDTKIESFIDGSLSATLSAEVAKVFHSIEVNSATDFGQPQSHSRLGVPS